MKKRWMTASPKGRGDTPTSIIQSSRRSPQLYGKTAVALNNFTTKNTEAGCFPYLYNLFINGRLAYRRAARGGAPDDNAASRFGPKAERLTKNNYKMLKKGQKVYYDRDSVYFRGPFVFQRLTRGSLLNFTVRDAGYDIVYKFVIKPSQLEKETLYAVTQNLGKTAKRKYNTMHKTRHKTRRKKKHKTRRKRRKKHKGGRKRSKSRRKTRRRYRAAKTTGRR